MRRYREPRGGEVMLGTPVASIDALPISIVDCYLP